MRRRFFVDGFEGGSATLAGDAANHLGRVLRAERGQLFELSDGESLWLAETETVGRDEIHFSLVEQLPVHMAALRITLLLAVVKFDRFEWAIEKATELGADEIVPLVADRSEHGLIAAAAKRAQRWERILTESAQQARRMRVPLLREAAKPRDAFAAAGAQVRLLLSERSGAQADARIARACGRSRSRRRPNTCRHCDWARRRLDGRGIFRRGGIRIFRSRSGGKYHAHGNGRVRRAGGGAIRVWRLSAERRAGKFAIWTEEGKFVRERTGKTLIAKSDSSGPRATQEVSTEKSDAASWNANLYDAKHGFVWKYGSDVVSLLAPQPGERILDLGCGTGHLTAQIAESGARVVGVDQSPEMVLAARAAYPKLKFEVADARELKFDQEFDAVFSNAVLHWIHEPVPRDPGRVAGAASRRAVCGGIRRQGKHSKDEAGIR